MVRYWGEPLEGWHFTKNYGQYQKCGGRVVVYVEQQLFGSYRANLYLRPLKMCCELEARVGSYGDPTLLFVLAQHWFEKYQDGDVEKMQQDLYHIENPIGVWGRVGAEQKLMYIDRKTRSESVPTQD